MWGNVHAEAVGQEGFLEAGPDGGSHSGAVRPFNEADISRQIEREREKDI